MRVPKSLSGTLLLARPASRIAHELRTQTPLDKHTQDSSWSVP